MLDTTFQDTVSAASGNEPKRKETLPQIHKLHNVPKQVSDTAQSVGVNEKFMESGLPSGVLLPSQIAHDRWLAIIDALVDNIIIFIIAAIVVTGGFNYISYTVLTISIFYMWFHLVWWQKGIVWETSETVREYLSETKKYYFAFLYLFMGIVSIGGTYGFLNVNGPYYLNYILKGLKSMLDALVSSIKELFNTNEVLKNEFDKIKNDVSEFEPLDTTQHLEKADPDIVKHINTVSNHIANINIDVTEYILNFFSFYIFTFIFLFFTALYYKKHYEIKKSKNIKAAHQEKKHYIESTIDSVEEYF